jgi:L-asparagine transporter-like permease
MRDNQFRPILPIIIVFIVINGFSLFGRSLLANWNIDASVLIAGNLVLFLVTCASYILSQRAMKSTNPQVFIRAMYGSFMIKLFICAIAALVYILSFKKDVNKPAIFLCLGFYLVYSFFEVSMLTKLTKKKKNV